MSCKVTKGKHAINLNNNAFEFTLQLCIKLCIKRGENLVKNSGLLVLD